MPTAAELALILKFRDQATAAARTAFNAVAHAGVQAANLPRRAFEAFEGTVNRINSVIRLFRRALFEVTLAMSPLIGALAIAAQHNTVVGEQMQRLSRTFRDVATQIGVRLLPVLQAFADWFERNAPKIVTWFEQLPRHIARALLRIGQMLAEFAQTISAKFPEAAEAVLVVVRGLQAGARASRDFGNAMAEAAAHANTATAQMGAGIRIVFNEAFDRLSNFGNLAKELANTGINGLQASMESLFTTLITRSQSAKEAFRNFALGVLQMIAQMIAKLIVAAVLMTILGVINPTAAAAARVASSVAIPAATKSAFLGDVARGATVVRHAGGMIPSFQSGGEVPALLEAGEFVVNRRATARNLDALQRINAGGQAQPSVQNVFIVNATDAASFRGRIQEHADIIEAIFQRAMRRNSGPMREAVRI